MRELDLITIYRNLRKNSFSTVMSFRSDWRIDRKALRSVAIKYINKDISRFEFVHTSTATATHLWFVRYDRLDIPRPYLFSQATPRETMEDISKIFAPWSKTLPDNAVIQHFDGSDLSIIDKETAYNIFKIASTNKSIINTPVKSQSMGEPVT